jgi:pyruvate dehydrogenase E1 component alpha subunit
MYGDGSANQGQLFESANMAGLWKLPIIYVIENNHYGMGTSIERASYYRPLMGKLRGYPGLQVDGANVFAVREATKFAKQYSLQHGPMFLEFETYRYQGHSMSDPGVTYRTKEEVKQYRTTKDCIDYVKNLLIKHNFATEDDIKALEKKVRDEIENEIEQIRKDPFPEANQLITNIYVEKDVPFIRGLEYEHSFFNEHKI